MMDLCLPTSAGGHLDELLAIEEAYAERPHAYAMPPGPLAERLAARGDRVLALVNPQRNPLRLPRNIVQARSLLRRERPQVVLTTGAGLVVPLCLMAKRLGARLIYIETAARVHHPSPTGRVLYRFADHFLVQWPELLDAYPRAEVCRPTVFERALTAPVVAGPGRGTFIATGSHNQGLDRLLKAADEAAAEGLLPEPIVAQDAASAYTPRHFTVARALTREQVEAMMAERQLILCHGGAGLVATALRHGRKPIVLPRRRAHHEHVDDHQVGMTAKLARLGLVVSLDETPLASAVELAAEPPSLVGGLTGPPMAERVRALLGQESSESHPLRSQASPVASR